MACRLFGAKPSYEPRLTYYHKVQNGSHFVLTLMCKLDSQENISINFICNENISLKKMHLEMVIFIILSILFWLQCVNEVSSVSYTLTGTGSRSQHIWQKWNVWQ